MHQRFVVGNPVVVGLLSPWPDSRCSQDLHHNHGVGVTVGEVGELVVEQFTKSFRSVAFREPYPSLPNPFVDLLNVQQFLG